MTTILLKCSCLYSMIFINYYFGEIVVDKEHGKIKKTPDRISDDDDFNNGKVCKISNV